MTTLGVDEAQKVEDASPLPLATSSAPPVAVSVSKPSAWSRGVSMLRGLGDFARRRPRRVVTVGVALGIVATVVPLVAMRSEGAPPSPSSTSSVAATAKESAGPKPFLPPSALSGLDLKSIAIDDTGAIASAAAGRVAKLTLDPSLQLATAKLLAKHKIPQAAVVAIEPSTGKVLAYASQGGDGKDLAAEAFAPSASVFKIVTGSALVQVAGVPIDTKLCYNGGEQKIVASDLKDDPKHDVYCATMSQAMGRSINVIFAKLATRKLTAPDLNAVAAQFGYGTAIPFDVPVAPSKIDLPTETLEFARAAAGFWHTTLSPLHGALIASTIANGGTMMRPFIVSEIDDGSNVVFKAAAPTVLRKVIEPQTASDVGKMMLETVSQGTSYKAFHDKSGKSFLPGIDVAGKTGTLNQTQPLKLFTWFVGFAPAKNPTIAVSVLVVNDPVWKVKANVIGREVLQAYFVEQGAQGVVAPPMD